MALTEEEEFELLSLERERAMVDLDTPDEPSFFKKLGDLGLEFAEKGPITAIRERFSANPEPVLNQLPTAGMVVGGLSGGLPGAGAGGMAGEAARQYALGAIGSPSAPGSELEAGLGVVKKGAEGLVSEMGGQAMGPALKAVGRNVLKPASRFAELMTGTPARTFTRVADDPASILPSWLGGPKSLREAGKELGESEAAAGFFKPALTETGERATGLASLKGQRNPFISEGEVANGYFERLASGETLKPDETWEAFKSIAQVVGRTSRRDPNYVRMVQAQNVLRDELASLSPEWIERMAEYARSATGARATNILPRTQTGKVSQGRVGFNSLITGGGLMSGGLPGALGAFATSSPLTYGVTAAGAGVAAKTIGAAAQNPVTSRTFSSLITQYKNRDKQVYADTKPLAFENDIQARAAAQRLKLGTKVEVNGNLMEVVKRGRGDRKTLRFLGSPR